MSYDTDLPSQKKKRRKARKRIPGGPPLEPLKYNCEKYRKNGNYILIRSINPKLRDWLKIHCTNNNYTMSHAMKIMALNLVKGMILLDGMKVILNPDYQRKDSNSGDHTRTKRRPRLG